MHIPTAIAYVRVSTADQVDSGLSLSHQEERVRAYAAAAGLTLVAVLIEEGVSGSVPLAERPQGAELLRLTSDHKGCHVIALKLDRLFRDAADCLAQTKAWDAERIALHLVDMGGQAINTASAMGRMFLTMAAGFAELERALIAERTTAALRVKKARGEVYGQVPYGFSRDGNRLVPNPAEMAVIDRIRAQRRAGTSFGRIAADLNAAAVPTKGGKGVWYPMTVKLVTESSIDTAAPSLVAAS